MAPGDQWKIHLGRRICLSYDDIDGSVFIEDLIDEIMHCPRPDRWVTVKRKGIWCTRPVEFPRDANGDDNDVEIDSNGSLVDDEEGEGQWYKDGGYGDDDDEMYEEDWRYENDKEMDKNPLMLFDEYDKKDDETDDEEEMEILEQFMEQAMESDTDWDAEDPTKKEEERMSDADEEEEEKENEGDDGDEVTATGINDEALGTALKNIGQGDLEANVLGVEDDGEDEDDLDSDEPGSDWDSNDGIE